MKKYKPSKIGLNPEWFKLYFFIPMLIIISFLLMFFFINDNYKRHLTEKEVQESIQESERLIKESIQESESYERYLKELYRKKQEEKENKSKIEKAEDMNYNEKYKNKLLEEKWPKGTYVYDSKNNIYGVVSNCMIPVVNTKEGWSFSVDYDTFLNKDIKQTGWLQWHNWTKRKEKSKTLSKEEKEKAKRLIDEENSIRSSNARKKFPPNPIHGKCKYNGKYYFVYDWKDGILKLLEVHSKEKHFLYVQYDDENVKNITPDEINYFFMIKED